jgi:hypothetical protein
MFVTKYLNSLLNSRPLTFEIMAQWLEDENVEKDHILCFKRICRDEGFDEFIGQARVILNKELEQSGLKATLKNLILKSLEEEYENIEDQDSIDYFLIRVDAIFWTDQYTVARIMHKSLLKNSVEVWSFFGFNHNKNLIRMLLEINPDLKFVFSSDENWNNHFDEDRRTSLPESLY